MINCIQFSSVQSLSRVQLCDPMNRSTPGLPVHHQLPEFTQTHVHPAVFGNQNDSHILKVGAARGLPGETDVP